MEKNINARNYIDQMFESKNLLISKRNESNSF